MFASVLLLATLAIAAPLAPVVEERAYSQVSTAELAGFAPYTQFARAAYCGLDGLKNWNCGQACSALSDFTPTLVGGDGAKIQQYVVGYWASKNAVVVAHQGTDPTQLESLLTDVQVLQRQLSTTLFPGISSSVYVHSGFADQHALTASVILAEVKKLFTARKTSNLVLVGHSLGGALAEIDSVFFALQLPQATITTRTFGLPRVGNAAWAEVVDAKVPDFVRVNNRKDLIPIIPGRGLGFAHPEGEVHIVGTGDAVACEGNDNASDGKCTISSVPNIFGGNIIDHLGPYEGIYIGTIFCT
ncbi:alpha/beta-hydrolase [Cylindrobasidium torrendii FP15055 ss-10]|uniref:Alpha/beta-hydrolase n=1 Tax=Cylindrobasidium torrendii FP15055 ss-10 TaxID=1314674 RepID=A0A0D7AVX8_9AGAR|nr:alpha/beta-hydrolase [Cylindrobasidium torrendii FP15055 ss-10]